MFKQVIVRAPGRSLVEGLTEANLGPPDYALAEKQHRDYVDALRSCGVSVTCLPPAEDFPDAVFVEDAALCTPRFAILTRPGASSRRDEAALLEPTLRRFFAIVETIEAPGTLDAGDVMMVDQHYYIGLSARTNVDGANQLISILERHGLQGSTVRLSSVLHLKTAVAYLENATMLVAGEMRDRDVFQRYRRIAVPDNEAYAANSIWVNDHVIMPAGYPRTRQKLEALGYPVIETEVSEYRKLDGGVSCLSLRF